MLTRETVTFRDVNGWSWEFDLTFIVSNYRCIWGRGCPDTRLQHTARGCCVDGVEIYQGDGDTVGSEDLKRIRGRVRQLTDEDWQNRQVACQRGGRDPWGKARFKRDSVHTRLYRGACIFHNRVDHPRRGWLRVSRRGAAPEREPDGLEAADLLAGPAVLRYRRRRPRQRWCAPARPLIGAGRGPLTGGAPSTRTRSAPINRCTSPWRRNSGACAGTLSTKSCPPTARRARTAIHPR